MEYLVLAARLLIGLTFTFALVSKVRTRASFTRFKDTLGSSLPGFTAALVLSSEAAIIVLLAIPWTVPLGFLCAAGTLAVFTGYLIWNLRGKNPAPCLCFGGTDTPAGVPHIARNLVLLVIALCGAALSATTGALPTYEVNGLMVSLLAGLAAAIVIALLDDVIALFGT
ncbi:MauE/DoxX family redox-associated membrane protein [Nonomuraea sp. NPDC059023]|uniref:MauE/DoxX family redox-associated membrane protein n=1 Tax=unclassified Nonomuraea TaxID=2593643 RepID=UPI00369A316E